MSFIDEGNTTLADLLGRQAETAGMNIQNQYARKRKQAVSQQAHAGRLTSGVANYPLGDIDAGEAGAQAGVESALSSALADVPVGDYSTQQDNSRKRELAQLLAELSKPSALEEALGALGSAGNIAGTFAAFA